MELLSGFSFLTVIIYIVIGLAVSTFGTLIGAGGGIIFVPLFLWAFDWEPPVIIGTSLAIVFFNAVFATFAYGKQRKIKYDAAIPFAAATVPGAWLGASFADGFDAAEFRISFGILLFLVALLIVWKNKKIASAKESSDIHFPFSLSGGLIISFFIGFISSAFGIGGGVIHVPAMIGLLGFPPHIATATSQFVLMISALIGVTAHAFSGHVEWSYAFLFGIGAIFGALFGARLSKKVKGSFILSLLAFALFLLSIRLMFS